jgi:hypothetical protein
MKLISEKVMKKITIKPGDIITVTGLYFQVPDWRDDQPCVLLSPVIEYRESSSADRYIEDFLIDVVCNGYYENDDLASVDESLKWAGKSLQSVKKAVRKSLKTRQKPYKGMYSEIISVDVEIIEKNGELDYRILKSRTI